MTRHARFIWINVCVNVALVGAAAWTIHRPTVVPIAPSALPQEVSMPVCARLPDVSYRTLDVARIPGYLGDSQPGVYWVTAASQDGTMIAGAFVGEEGTIDHSVCNVHGFVWTRKTGWVDLSHRYPALDNVFDVASASDDGKTLISRGGTAQRQDIFVSERGVIRTQLRAQAARWLRQNLPLSGMVNAYKESNIDCEVVSPDGSTMLLRCPGFSTLLWKPVSGFSLAKDLPPTATIRAMTADGSIVAGCDGNLTFPINRGEAFVWSAKGGIRVVPYLPKTGQNIVYALSRDGSIAAGVSGNRLFRQIQSGAVEDLGRLPGNDIGGNVYRPGYYIKEREDRGFTISDRGNVIVGENDNIPFLWTPATGTVALKDVLVSTRAEVAGMKIYSAVVSPDGAHITGFSAGDSTDLYRWQITLR